MAESNYEKKFPRTFKELPKNTKKFAVAMRDAEDVFNVFDGAVSNLPKHISVMLGECHELRHHIENDVIDFDENLCTLTEALVQRILSDMTIMNTFTFEQWSEMKEYMIKKYAIFQKDISSLVEGSTKLIENQKKHEVNLGYIIENMEIGGTVFRQMWNQTKNIFRAREFVAQRKQIEGLLYGDNSAPKKLIGVTEALVNMLESFQSYLELILHCLSVIPGNTSSALQEGYHELHFDILQVLTKEIMEYCNLYLMSIPDISAQMYSISFMQ